MDAQFTHILVGGGLHNGLTALALHALQPQARVALVESAALGDAFSSWSGSELLCGVAAATVEPGKVILSDGA